MEHNNKIRQIFRDKTGTMVMGCTHDGIPFSPEYVLWLENELNKLLIADVVAPKGTLVCTYCGIQIGQESCPNPKKCTNKEKINAN